MWVMDCQLFLVPVHLFQRVGFTHKLTMKRSAFVLLIMAAMIASAFAQTSTITKVELSPTEVDRIIKKITANEAAFRTALTNYVFDRNATIQTLGMGGQITGTYRRDSSMVFTGDGQRIEKIVFFPIPTLTEISVTPEDLEDLGGINPFALEPSAVSQYNFTLLGKEKIDELNLYVFDVTPKVIPDPGKTKQRLFTGRIWVDDRDLMIVKSKGKAVPETKKNKFPVVETWRENVDGKYWFPSYSASDDELVFDNGLAVKLKMRVKYADYKLGRTDVRIIDEGDVVEEKPSPSPRPTPKKPE
jgi:outer membrane lipoprotein-sorting protein